MAFDSNMAPIVGQQVTLTATNWNVASPRISLLLSRAAVGDCDLVAKANTGADETGYLFNNIDRFIVAFGKRPPVTLSHLRSLAHMRSQNCRSLRGDGKIAYGLRQAEIMDSSLPSTRSFGLPGGTARTGLSPRQGLGRVCQDRGGANEERSR